MSADGCEAGEDSDADGALDPGETNPNDADTDDGGVPDGIETGRGTDPLDPSDDFPARQGKVRGSTAFECATSWVTGTPGFRWLVRR